MLPATSRTGIVTGWNNNSIRTQNLGDSNLKVATAYARTMAGAVRERCDVSVIVPVYNRASLLRWPMASIAAQTLLPLEVIVVDDGSSTEEAAKIRSIVEEFDRLIDIRILVTEKNSGVSHARNRGIFEARGKYVAFIDSDDLWLPEKLEKQMRLIESTKHSDNRPVFSATGTYRVDSRGDILRRKLCNAIFDTASIQVSYFIPTSSIIVETSVAREINGFAEDMRVVQDGDFVLRLVGRVHLVALPDPLSVYVIHPGERNSQMIANNLRALLLIRRRHNMCDRVRENSDFYRKFAVLLQKHGKVRTAKQFYLRSIALKYSDGWRRRLVEGWLMLYFSIMEMPVKRRTRVRNPIERERDPKVRAQWDRDQQTIWALMG